MPAGVRRRCFRGVVAVDLTARELEVLAFLLDHPDETVGKAQLLEAVWGRDFHGDPNIVEVYVSQLRRKLDEPFTTHTITTVRGQGYRLQVSGQP